jgi:hypothetical protein
MTSINCAIQRERQYVREYSINVVKGKILLATANYNLAADESSCVDKKVREMYPGLNKPVLSIRAGDNIRFIGMTGFEDIAFGELVSPENDDSRDAEMATANTIGCFSTLRCTFARGNEPDVPETSLSTFFRPKGRGASPIPQMSNH